MSDYEQAVFISYAWGEETHEREAIVNQLDQSLQKRGLKIIRDKRDLGYKGMIRQFMERIGEGSCIIVVLSDKYLRSKNCMYELVEIAENKNFLDRVFPIVLSDAKIYDAIDRINYKKYWKQKKEELNQEIISLGDLSNNPGIFEELDDYDRFGDEFDRLTTSIKNMNTLSPDILRESDFQQLYDAIIERIPSPINDTLPPDNQLIEVAYFEPQTILIPEGSFWMGSDEGPGIPKYETPRHEVHLPAFRMGKTPVTNAQFEEFVRDMHRSVSPEMGWDGQKVPAGEENFPVVGVTFYEAVAYCDWLSRKTDRKYALPNEAQWEKACRGGTHNIYPWGDEMDAERSNHGQTSLSIVDLYPEQNEYGVFDMVGNVRQWTCTVWGEKRIAPDARYAYPYKDDGRNDLNASRQLRRVVRGSTMNDDARWLRCSARSGQVPDDAGARISFRVAMTV